MEFKCTQNGTCMIEINTDVYMSFGNNEEIKFIHIHYPTISGSGSCSRMFKVPLAKLPRECTKSIGKKNIKQIRELLQKWTVDGTLSRKHLNKIGAAINSDPKSK